MLGLLRGLRPTRRPSVDNGPAHQRVGYPPGGRPRMVPTFTTNRSMREAPTFTPTASPRLRRRHFTVASPPDHSTGFGVSRPAETGRPRTAHRPISVRFEPALDLRGVRQRFLTYAFPSLLAGPGPSDSPNPSRTLSEAAYRPPRHSPDQAASQLHRPAATDQRQGPFTPTRFLAPRGARTASSNHWSLPSPRT